MSKKKKIIIAAGICFGLFLLLSGGFRIWLGSRGAQQMIQAKVNAAIPGNIAWEDLDFSLLTGRIDIQKPLILGPADERIIEADRLSLNLSLPALMRGDLRVESLVLEKPQVRMRSDKEGNLNIVRAFSAPNPEKEEETPSGGGMPFNILAREIQLTDGFFSYEMEKESGEAEHIRIENIRLLLKDGNFAERSGQVELDLGKGEADLAGLKTVLRELRLAGAMDKGNLSALTLKLDSDMGNMDISGDVADSFSAPRLNMALELETELEKIRQSLALETELSGPVRVQLKAGGRPENPDAELKLTYGGGNLAGNRVERLELICRMKDRKIDISGLNLQTETGSIEAEGQADLSRAFPRGFFSAQRDMEALSYSLHLKQSGTSLETLARNAGMSGHLASLINLEGSGVSLENLRIKADAEISGEKISVDKVLEATDATVKAGAVLEKGIVSLHSVLLNAGTVNLRGEGNYSLNSKEIQAKVHISSPDFGALLSALHVPDFSGNVLADAEIFGNISRPAVELQLKGEGLGFQETAIGNLRAGIGLDSKGSLHFSEVFLKNKGSELSASGTMQLFKEGFSVDPELLSDIVLTLQNVEAGDFIKEKNSEKSIKGSLSGKIHAKGPIMKPAADAELKAKALAFGPTPVGDADAVLSFADGLITLKNLDVRNGQSAVNLSGTARLMDAEMKMLPDPVFDLKLVSSGLYPEDFTENLKGKISLKALVKGSLKSPVLDISLKGQNMAEGKNRIGDLDADVRFADGSLLLDTVQVRNGKSGLDIKGQARILDTRTGKMLEDPEFDINMSGDALFLEDFFQGMKGKLALNGHVSGSRNRPKGNVSIEGGKMDLGVQRIDGLHLNSRLDGEKVNIESFLVAMAPGENIVTDGWVSPLRRNYDLRMKSDGISMKHIDSLSGQDFGRGKISFRLAGKGSFENPSAEGDIRINGLTLKKKVLDDLKIHVDIRDHLARISGNLYFDMDAQYHLKSKDFSAKLRFDHTDLTPFFNMAGRDDLKGSLSGIIEAMGNSDRPEEIRAVADLSDLEIFLKDTELIRSENLKASFEKGEIRVPGIRISLLKEGNLTISGKGTIRADGKGPLDFRAEGDIPLQVIRLLDEDLEDARGSIRVTAGIKGSAEKPDFRAIADLKGISMTVPGLLQKLHDLKGQIQITPDELLVKGIEGQLDEGRFELSGNAELKNFQPGRMRFRLSGNRIPIRVPDTADILLNTELTLRGRADKSSVSGEVLLLEGQYYKDVKIGLLENLSKVGQKSRTASAPASEASPFLKNMQLNIALNARNPFVVDNNIALIMLRPDMKIIGTAANPLVSGRAETDSGTIIYQSREFEIQKGVIDFLNPYKTEPSFDIQGQAQIRKWLVYLTVSGTPDNLKFELRSDPQEEHGDILSLLVLGKTTKEMISGDGGSTSATQLLADALAEKLGEGFKDATALDSLELGYSEGENADDSRIKVTVGKELSRRLSVKYGVESRSGETVQKATTEYRFLENLLMSAFRDTAGVFGGELIFRLEFR